MQTLRPMANKSKNYFKYGEPLLPSSPQISVRTISSEMAAQAFDALRVYLRGYSGRQKFVEREINDGLTHTAGAAVSAVSTILGREFKDPITFIAVRQPKIDARAGEAYKEKSVMVVNVNVRPGEEIYRSYLRIVGVTTHEAAHISIAQNSIDMPIRLEEGICELVGAIGKAVVEGKRVDHVQTLRSMSNRAVGALALFKERLDKSANGKITEETPNKLYRINSDVTSYCESPYILARLMLDTGRDIALKYNGNVDGSDFTIPFTRVMLYNWGQHVGATQSRPWSADMIQSSLKDPDDSGLLVLEEGRPTEPFIRDFHEAIVQKMAAICCNWSEIQARIR